MNIELMISDEAGTELSQPAAVEGIEWSTERRSTPGKLTFKVLGTDGLNFSEGSAVRLKVDGQKVFFGFIFTQKRDKENIITVTAYDQMRYLNNKDIYIYENLTATDLVKMIAADFQLNLGEIEDTGFIIASGVEDGSTLLDMIENALDLTLTNNKEMFVLYDDFGQLTLKNISNMYVQGDSGYFMIDEECGENFEYTSSIDSNTYNKIKLAYAQGEGGARDIYVAQSSENMNKWGILQYFDNLSEGENGQSKADALLSLYNNKTRNLKITRAFGNVGVRAGSMIVVYLNLGDIAVQNFMLVEKVKHTFKQGEHVMDLTLRGGDFIA